MCEGAAPDSTAAKQTNQRGGHACRRPPARTHALIILRLGIDSWDCRGCGHEFLGQQDARHKVHKSKVMLQDALILAEQCGQLQGLHKDEGLK